MSDCLLWFLAHRGLVGYHLMSALPHHHQTRERDGEVTERGGHRSNKRPQGRGGRVLREKCPRLSSTSTALLRVCWESVSARPPPVFSYPRPASPSTHLLEHMCPEDRKERHVLLVRALGPRQATGRWAGCASPSPRGWAQGLSDELFTGAALSAELIPSSSWRPH